MNNLVKLVALWIAMSSSLLAQSNELAQSKDIATLETQLANQQGLEKVETHLQLAKLLERSDYTAAIKHSDAALTLLADQNAPALKVRALTIKAFCLITLRRKPEAQDSIAQAISLAQQSKNNSLLADALQTQTIIHVYNRKLDQAREAGLRVLKIREASNSPDLQKALHNLGIVEDYSGNYSLALQYHFRAVKLAEAANDQTALAKSFQNIGIIKRIIEEHDEALGYFEKSLRLKQAIDPNDIGITRLLNSMANAHLELEQHEAARARTREGLTILGERTAPRERVRLLVAQGRALTGLERFEEANTVFAQAKDVALASKNSTGEQLVNRYFAWSLLKQDRPAEALTYVRKNIDTYDIKNPRIYGIAYKIYQALGDYENAFKYLELSSKMQRESLKKGNERLSLELEKQYETAKLKEEVTTLAHENETQRLQQQWIIGSAIVVALILLMLFRLRTVHIKTVLLEQKIKERTQELEDKKDTISHLLARKNKLFSNVSHEFRTPLTLILGPLNSLMRDKAAAAFKDIHQGIANNAMRLLKMIDELLELARLDEGVKKTEAVINASQAIPLLVESFRSLSDEKNIELRCSVDPELLVKGNKNDFETVFINLIANAIKFTPAQGQIAISVKRDNQSVVIEVADSGIGIDVADSTLIFERFARIEPNQGQTVIQGTGIGLALVKELTLQMQGQVSYRKNSPQGSVFSVVLPLDSSPAGEFAPAADEQLTPADNRIDSALQALSQEITAQQSTAEKDSTRTDSADIASEAELADNKATVLVIEDNVELRRYLLEQLRPHFQVLEASDGEAGIRLAQEAIPDLIISDVMMPKKDGFAVAAEIRKNELSAHIPIILLTAKNDDESKIAGWREGVDEYMTKPFDMDHLITRVTNILSIREILRKRYVYSDNDESLETGKPELDPFIEQLNRVLSQSFHDVEFDVEDLAKALAIGRTQLYRKLRAVVDYTPKDYLREFRLKRAKKLLDDQMRVGQVAEQCGFRSQSYFSSCFSARFGETPKQFQAKQRVRKAG